MKHLRLALVALGFAFFVQGTWISVTCVGSQREETGSRS